jgi:hypothetical protein
MNNFEKIGNENEALGAESLLTKRIQSVSESLFEEYASLDKDAKKIAKEEISEYIERLDEFAKNLELDYLKFHSREKFEEEFNKDLKNGIEEIIDSAKEGRRDRKDVSVFEQRGSRTKLEKKDFKREIKMDKKDKKEDKRLIREIQEKYKKLIEEEKK